MKISEIILLVILLPLVLIPAYIFINFLVVVFCWITLKITKIIKCTPKMPIIFSETNKYYHGKITEILSTFAESCFHQFYNDKFDPYLNHDYKNNPTPVFLNIKSFVAPLIYKRIADDDIKN